MQRVTIAEGRGKKGELSLIGQFHTFIPSELRKSTDRSFRAQVRIQFSVRYELVKIILVKKKRGVMQYFTNRIKIDEF